MGFRDDRKWEARKQEESRVTTVILTALGKDRIGGRSCECGTGYI